MAYDDYDLTAPYRGAVDVTSKYLIPAMENTPAGMAGRALRSGASKMYSNFLRAPLQRGGQAMSQALQGVPGVGPLGVMKDTAGVLAGLGDPNAPAAPAAPAAPGAPPPPAAAAPMAMGSPAPAPMPAPSPSPQMPSPAGTLAAPAAPSPEPKPGAAATVTPGGEAPIAGTSNTPSPEDAVLQQRQKALDAYYTGVIGTGAGQRKADRMYAISNSLRGGGGGRDWGSQLGEGLSGIARGYSLYKGLKSDDEREKQLEDLRQQYLRGSGGGGGEGPVSY